MVESGQIGYINMSTIFSQLIVLASRHCDCFQSGVVYDINTVTAYMTDRERLKASKRFVFGFRQCGVDGNSYALLRTEGAYRALWVLDIERDGDSLHLSFWEANLNVPHLDHMNRKTLPGWKLSRACIRETLLAKRQGILLTQSGKSALIAHTLRNLRDTHLAPHVERNMIAGRYAKLYRRK